ncbi:60S ribosomal protein L35ae, putative [Plasmodium knowlesi strain H]|uniref:60S ribosomal protein L35ae, putative n=3 Tax=Plasmodium knowlesi TaxID=5850 RepID=A0A5K1U0L8_PLAKH|nr:60S ribosomal protein L35ae, putative [Plasmodium knowlesi strain H]OTN65123.1 putative 60S ribosomal protein L35ae [Plasmodium knowlesi]CAA9988447.1 60S ribosomal protein L35ae, putative [Plasmodium knowlesi strain H]SBO19838.1 60S ribosomal protein L35ae, putative [Plasmodium knowlesi strain H]SBO20440.1 60S ribosomal protein L35ae, putative [Plasmodium knowlesi strain H]VVS77921.1 60S ribosomal protein L35ae, putative [Plasmodium knowlesi strain H]|eukprot:XP_002259428.1 ribosomal protein, putative [Plasmodium knowlesi strain H]
MDKTKTKKQITNGKGKKPAKVVKKVVKKVLGKKKKTTKKLNAVRLYEKGVILGYKRSQRNQDPNFALISIRNVHTKKHAQFYVGKRVAYVYRTNKHHDGVKIKCIWGKVCRTHGNSGVIRAKFKTNIPPKAFGDRVRILMYPSNI